MDTHPIPDTALQSVIPMDILRDLLRCENNPKELCGVLVERMCAFTDARCVALIELSGVPRILSITPKSGRSWVESEDARPVYEKLRDKSEMQIWRASEPSEISDALSKAGYAFSISLPLCFNDIPMNVLLVLGVPETVDTHAVKMLADVAALALRKTPLIVEQIATLEIFNEALRSKMEKMQRMFNVTLDLLCIASTSGRFLFLNPAWEKTLGYTEAELLATDFLDLVHPDDVQSTLHTIAALSSQHEVVNFVNRYRCKDGQYRWLEWCSTPQGGLIYAAARDITERRKAQDDYHQIFNQMLDGFSLHEIICNSDGHPVDYRFLAVNPAFERLTGLKAADIVGKTALEVMPQTEAWWIEGVGQVALTAEPAHFENYAADLNRHFEVTVFCPSPNQFAAIFVDATQRKRAEKERHHLEEQLAQTQKMDSIGQLASGVAHDFNNILSVIIGNGEMMQDDIPPNSPLSESLSEILAAGERASNLTRQLLAFSRKQVLATTSLDLNTVVSGMDKMIRRLLGEYIEVRTQLMPGIGYVNGDLSQLEQVLLNLCVNARDAMPEGGVLTIKTDSVYLDEHYTSVHGGAAPGSYCMLSVSDTGCGIDEKTRGQIFDPFFTTKKKGKGTGLGLATVYGVVKQHGGNIWLYSEVGQGSVFKIYLPQVNLVVTERELEKQKRVLAKGGEVVLVVEDEAPLRKIIGRMLQHLGYVPLETAYGAEAVECAKQEGRIDLLLTDVIMPGMNGRQVYEAVSAIRPGIKTVFMSGYTDNVIAQHGVLEGSIPFIPKPFSEAVLSQKIQEALQG